MVTIERITNTAPDALLQANQHSAPDQGVGNMQQKDQRALPHALQNPTDQDPPIDNGINNGEHSRPNQNLHTNERNGQQQQRRKQRRRRHISPPQGMEEFRSIPRFKGNYILKAPENRPPITTYSWCKFALALHRKLSFKPKRLSPNFPNECVDIEISNQEQLNEVRSVQLEQYPFVVVENVFKHESQGIIKHRNFLEGDEEDIRELLNYYNSAAPWTIKSVHKITKKDNGIIVPTVAIRATFDTPDLPDKIEVVCGLLKEVELHVPRPRRCFKCQQYGHSSQKCRSAVEVCAKCALIKHDEGEPCPGPLTCANCGQAHAAYSADCDRFKYEQKLLYIKARDKLSFREAHEAMAECQTREGQSYAAVLKRSRVLSSSRRRPPMRRTNTLSASYNPEINSDPILMNSQTTELTNPTHYDANPLQLASTSTNVHQTTDGYINSQTPHTSPVISSKRSRSPEEDSETGRQNKTQRPLLPTNTDISDWDDWPEENGMAAENEFLNVVIRPVPSTSRDTGYNHGKTQHIQPIVTQNPQEQHNQKLIKEKQKPTGFQSQTILNNPRTAQSHYQVNRPPATKARDSTPQQSQSDTRNNNRSGQKGNNHTTKQSGRTADTKNGRSDDKRDKDTYRSLKGSQRKK